MKQAVLKAWDLPWLSATALILFVICFSLYAWWTYRRENKAMFEQVALLPLDDSQVSSTSRKVYE